MCGIAGVVSGDIEYARGAVHRMNQAQLHRGPDDVGLSTVPFGERTLALGHRRLSILDLSTAGRQPMVDPTTGNQIVFNGEIYNYLELREELRTSGAVFRTGTDTEVILAAFAYWGIGALSRLAGMYALAIHAAREQRLYLARDPLGIKPLYYHADPHAFAFASELRAILACGVVASELDRRALASFFAYGAVPSPLTIVRDVRQVEPGSWIEIGPSSSNPSSARYHWSFPGLAEPDSGGRRHIEEIAAALKCAVRRHMQSDVPLGVFLSSGIDSTAVAALASEARGGDVDTFTVAVSGEVDLDESALAAETARALGVRHQLVRLPNEDIVNVARRWLASIDQPTIDGLNTYIISDAVRNRGITVALSGLGGDEVFGGYSSFREVPLLHLASRSMRRWSPDAEAFLARWLSRNRPAAHRNKAIDLAIRGKDLPSTYFARRRLFSDNEMRRFGFDEGELEDWIPPEGRPRAWLDSLDPWSTVRTLEMRFYMGNMLLRDTDVFGMAHGLEIRVPLLDQGVIDVALRSTRSLLNMALGRPKAWLRSAVAESIPSHVRLLPKRGFGLPLRDWSAGVFRSDLGDRIDSFARSGVVEGRTVRTVWSDFLHGPREIGSWNRPWALAVVGDWLVRRSGAPRHGSAAIDATKPA